MDPATVSTLIPILVVGAYHLLAHTTWGTKLFGAIGLSNPLAPSAPASHGSTAPTAPAGVLASHPVLSDAVNAAIKQTVTDVSSGHYSGLLAELKATVNAAVSAAMADLKPKI